MSDVDTVAVFATCMTDFAAPEPARAAVRVIEAMGYRAVVPEGQSCCGQPALNSGYPQAAARLVGSWARTFDGADAIVSVAGSCAAMMHHHGPSLAVGGDDADALDRTLPRLWEFSQFVAEFGGGLDLALDPTHDVAVTYHDSCHMTRMLGERHTPREVLARIHGVRLVEMTDSDTCCGFGGTFSVKYPEVSTSMADHKLDQARATGARLVVSSDPGCLTHLASRSARTSNTEQSAAPSGPPIEFVHLAELVARALPSQHGGAA